MDYNRAPKVNFKTSRYNERNKNPPKTLENSNLPVNENKLLPPNQHPEEEVKSEQEKMAHIQKLTNSKKSTIIVQSI